MQSFDAISDRLRNELVRLEDDPETSREHYVFGKLRALIPREVDDSLLPLEIRAELFAFTIHERRWTAKRKSNADQYYFIARENLENPLLSSELIDYYERRAVSCKHPYLKIRYADLAWDLCSHIKGIDRKPEMARLVIDTTLRLEKQSSSGVEHINLLARALVLARVLHDSNRISATINAILGLEDLIAVDELLGTWGFSFDLLWSVKLLREQTRPKIISDLEARLRRLCDPARQSKFDPNQARWAATRLAKAYRSTNQRDELRLALCCFRDAVRKQTNTEFAPLMMHWHQVLHGLFVENGLHEEAIQVRTDLVHSARSAKKFYVPIESSFTIPWDQLYSLSACLSGNTLADSLRRLALHFIPRRTAAFQKLKNQDAEFVFSSLTGNTFTGPTDYPVPIANTGIAGVDDSGRLIHDMAFGFQFSSAHLGFVIQAAFNTYGATPVSIIDFLRESDLFVDEKIQLLNRGLIAYMDHDFVVALHVLIPQIEAAVRRVLELQGEMPLKVSRRDPNAFHVLTFDQVLNHKLFQEAVREDVHLYFRTLFTDSRGWNLRNDISHGMLSVHSLNSVKADRVFHALLTLGLLRWHAPLPAAEMAPNGT